MAAQTFKVKPLVDWAKEKVLFDVLDRAKREFYVRLHQPPSTSSERLESPECVTYILGKRRLLVVVHACVCPSPSAVGSSKRVTFSFSWYSLLTRPFTGAINSLQSLRRQRTCSSSSSWHLRRRSLASSREAEHRRTGQIRLAYQLPWVLGAVHLPSSLPQNNEENVWELEAFELQQSSTIKLADEQLCDRGGRPMPSASPFSTLVTGNRPCETRIWSLSINVSFNLQDGRTLLTCPFLASWTAFVCACNGDRTRRASKMWPRAAKVMARFRHVLRVLQVRCLPLRHF